MSNSERFLTEPIVSFVKEVALHFSVEGEPQFTFVMTDIHGMAKFLHTMFVQILKKHKHPVAANFVFLGDYVDRGPHSAQVIAMVRLLQDLMPVGRVVALKGNHEDMFLENYKWYGFMGINTEVRRSFKDEFVPGDVIEWMTDLPLRHEDEKHYFVHAGFDPHKSYEDQDPSDMLWIRERFLKSGKNWGKHILHGHTPSLKLERKLNRTNLDTGACFEDGLLTCGILSPTAYSPVSFIQIDNKRVMHIY